jgi:hypothetical protein
MDKDNLEFLLKENIVLSLSSFIYSLLTAAILCFLIHLFYLRYSSTFSNKFNFSKNFIVLGITTTLIITIVKSSLALSLGLVGALSIVRFRAAIKEPEELVYLFLVISVGLGCGAGQLLITTTGILFILFLIYLFQKNNKLKYSQNLVKMNLSIIKNKRMSEIEINRVIAKIKPYTSQMDLISFSVAKNDTSINLDIVPKNSSNLYKLSNILAVENIQIVITKDNVAVV